MKTSTKIFAAVLFALACGSSDRLVHATIVTPPPVVTTDDAGTTTVVINVPDAGPPPSANCSPVGAEQSCYTGPPSTIGADGCHSGTTTCTSEGFWGQCEGESVPSPLLTDIVFILDNTDATCVDGMGVEEFIQAQQTVVNFILAYPETNFRWALLTVPGCGHVWPGAQTVDAGLGYALFQTLTGEQGALDAACFQCVDGDYPSGDPQCATQPVPAYAVLSEQLRGNIVPWDIGAQHFVILFTAAGQPPTTVVGETLMQDLSASDGGVQTIMFVDPQYSESCAGCGMMYPLGDADSMLSQLETSFTTVLTCQ